VDSPSLPLQSRRTVCHLRLDALEANEATILPKMLPASRSSVTASRFLVRSLPLLAALLGFLLAGATAARAETAVLTRWPTGDNVCVDAPLRLTFDKPPVLGATGKIEVCRAADGQPVETIVLGATHYMDRFGANDGASMLSYLPVRIEGATASIRLRAGSMSYGESYVVHIEPGVFSDFAGIAGDQWKFTTKAAPARDPDRLDVAADGSRDFCTVQGAVDQIQPFRTAPATIFIHNGRYEEIVRVGRERPYIRFVGEDRKGTVIACTNNSKLNPGWIQRSVLGVEGDHFELENLTVQNTTPYKGSQAEAVFVNAEHCTLKNANFLSFQDTLCLNGSVHIIGCYVEGDVDYLWGTGSGFFEGCELRSMHDGYLEQARNPVGKPGYLFLNCKLTAAPEVKRTWLARIDQGRFPYSAVVFIHCQMGPHIPAAGWQVTGTPPSTTLGFAEFQSTDLAGKLLDVTKRDPSGKQLSEQDATAQVAAMRTLTQ
jgi:pectin methylesterase-like acyl-CoA thioesterase